MKEPNRPEAIYQVEGSEASVFFTFNVLWEKEHLCYILDILDEHDIRAIFFITGEWLERNPLEAKKIVEKYGEDELHKTSKIHFKTTKRVLNNE